MSRRALTITVTVPGADGVKDAQGEPTPGTPVATSVLVKAFAPRESEVTAEDFGGRSITGGTVYGFPGTVIPTDAIVTIHGVDYVMDGELGDWDPAYTSGVVARAEGVQFSVKRAS